MDGKKKLLQRVALFSSLSNEELNLLAKDIELVKVPKDRVISKAGLKNRGLIIPIDTRLELTEDTSEGRLVSLSVAHPFVVVGLDSVLTNTTSMESVRIVDGGTVVLLPSEAFISNLSRNSTLAVGVAIELASKLQRVKRDRSILMEPRAFNRVFAYLLSIVSTGQDGERWVKELPAQQQIAEVTNTSRETVSRAISALNRSGVLVKVAQNYRVNDFEKLNKLVGVMPKLV